MVIQAPNLAQIMFMTYIFRNVRYPPKKSKMAAIFQDGRIVNPVALFDIELQPAHFHELFLHQYQCIFVLHYEWWVYNFKMATNFQNGSC